MNSIKEKINELKTNGYQLDFGLIIESALQNYKKIVLYAGSLLLLFTFIFIVFSSIVSISIFGSEKVLETLKPENLTPEKFSGDFLLIYTTSMLILSCLISPFQAGFLKMAECAEKGNEFRIATIFEYYKSPYLGRLIFSTLLISLFSLGVTNLVGLTGIENLSMLTSLTVTFMTFLTIPLIVFGKLNSLESIQSSVVLFFKQPLLITGLISIALTWVCLGFFAFIVGLFFTIPLLYSMQYAIYGAIIGFEEEEIKN